jgi:hypothetical protein
MSALLRLSLLSGRVVRVRPDIEESGRKRAASDVQIIAALSVLPLDASRGWEETFGRKPRKAYLAERFRSVPGTVNSGNQALFI